MWPQVILVIIIFVIIVVILDWHVETREDDKDDKRQIVCEVIRPVATRRIVIYQQKRRKRKRKRRRRGQELNQIIQYTRILYRIEYTEVNNIQHVHVIKYPSHSCAKELIDIFRGTQNKPTIYIENVHWRMNEMDKEGLRKLIRYGFNLEAWPSGGYNRIMLTRQLIYLVKEDVKNETRSTMQNHIDNVRY
jgi:hypothetical protein